MTCQCPWWDRSIDIRLISPRHLWTKTIIGQFSCGPLWLTWGVTQVWPVTHHSARNNSIYYSHLCHNWINEGTLATKIQTVQTNKPIRRWNQFCHHRDLNTENDEKWRKFTLIKMTNECEQFYNSSSSNVLPTHILFWLQF